MKYDYKERVTKLRKAVEINYNFLLGIVGEYHTLLSLPIKNNKIELRSF